MRRAAFCIAVPPTTSSSGSRLPCSDQCGCKVAAAQFFAQHNLPRISAERAIAEATDLSVMDLDEDAF